PHRGGRSGDLRRAERGQWWRQCWDDLWRWAWAGRGRVLHVPDTVHSPDGLQLREQRSAILRRVERPIPVAIPEWVSGWISGWLECESRMAQSGVDGTVCGSWSGV